METFVHEKNWHYVGMEKAALISENHLKTSVLYDIFYRIIDNIIYFLSKRFSDSSIINGDTILNPKTCLFLVSIRYHNSLKSTT